MRGSDDKKVFKESFSNYLYLEILYSLNSLGSKDGFCFSYFLAFFHYGLDKGIERQKTVIKI